MPRRIPIVLAASAAALVVTASPAAAAPTWTVSPSVNPVPTDNRLTAVTARTAQDAWAVGFYTGPLRHNGRIMLAEHWDGSTWKQSPTPNVQFFDEKLLAVGAAAANDVWAVGSTNQTGFATTNPITTHYDGAAWTIVSTPATSGSAKSILDGVVNFGASNAWAVGRSRAGRALVEHWDGTGWTIVPTPDPAVKAGSTLASSTLTGVSALSPSDIWAVGSYSVVTGTVSDAFTLIEHYNGVAWSIVPSPNLAPRSSLNGARQVLNAVAMISKTDGWAVGNTIDTASGSFLPDKSLALHWNGTAWSVVATPMTGTQNVLAGVSAASSTDVWAVGERVDPSGAIPVDRTLTLHWTGTTWTTVASPSAAGDSLLGGVSTLPGGESWAAGFTNSGPSIDQTLILHLLP
ncbi:MAG TPA: hypothetical protein VGP91_01750 [Actinoplanes sp.]|jgi:hypothetical protein|nr:hypothetical protein [Actinoplanes sp.]